jgi:hypothetical protein
MSMALSFLVIAAGHALARFSAIDKLTRDCPASPEAADELD